MPIVTHVSQTPPALTPPQQPQVQDLQTLSGAPVQQLVAPASGQPLSSPLQSGSAQLASSSRPDGASPAVHAPVQPESKADMLAASLIASQQARPPVHQQSRTGAASGGAMSADDELRILEEARAA